MTVNGCAFPSWRGPEASSKQATECLSLFTRHVREALQLCAGCREP